jgi:hypothetical protein
MQEEEVRHLVADGAPNKQVVAELGIPDAAGLTRYAIANGVIERSVQVTIIWPGCITLFFSRRIRFPRCYGGGRQLRRG